MPPLPVASKELNHTPYPLISLAACDIISYVYALCINYFGCWGVYGQGRSSEV